MLNFLAIINLIIAAQAVFLVIHFTTKKKGILFANRLIAFLSFSFGLVTFNTYISLIGYGNPIYQDITNNTLWFVGPAFYFFVVHHNKAPERKTFLLHTLPFVVLAILTFSIKKQWFASKIIFVAFAQMMVYLAFSIRFSVKNYKQSKVFYDWILPSLISFAFLMTLNLFKHLSRGLGYELLPNQIAQSFTTLLVFPIYFMAYKEMNTTREPAPKQKKYKTSPIPEQKAAAYLEKIQQAMQQDKLYLNTGLTLQLFSDAIDVPSKYISQTINKELGISFPEFVLQFRLEEVKKNLLDPQLEHLTINGIAKESGFASGSRFNHLFKEKMGMTPKQFRDQNQLQ